MSSKMIYLVASLKKMLMFAKTFFCSYQHGQYSCLLFQERVMFNFFNVKKPVRVNPNKLEKKTRRGMGAEPTPNPSSSRIIVDIFFQKSFTT